MSERLRAYRFTLDPTRQQKKALVEHAGSARWAYNYAVTAKRERQRARWLQIDELVSLGLSEKQARRQATVTVPNSFDLLAQWREWRGDERKGIDGICPWFAQVSSYVFSSAMRDADAAWKNWGDSAKGTRRGRKVGMPRRKKKGRSRDSFRIHHNTKKPTIRPDGYRRIRIPTLGSIRIHDSAKRLTRAIDRGAVVQSVTVSRGGHRWYASVLVKEPFEPPPPTHRQQQAGVVGVDLGVNHLAALPDGTTIDNPRHLQQARRKLTAAQRRLSRTQKGSNRRKKAAAQVGRIHAKVAEQRAGQLHQITKQLASGWATVALEDLNVTGMTTSAKGTAENPGRNVKAKSGLNRSILDVSPGEFRRQLDYKTSWYGSQLAVCDRWFPSSKTCSACGAVKTKLSLSERVFRCGCGAVLDRDVNAARNIAAAATVAPDGGETPNARGDHVNPPPSGTGVVVSETGRPGRTARSPRGSDPPTIPPPTTP